MMSFSMAQLLVFLAVFLVQRCQVLLLLWTGCQISADKNSPTGHQPGLLYPGQHSLCTPQQVLHVWR